MVFTRTRILIGTALVFILTSLALCTSPLWWHSAEERLSRERYSPALWSARAHKAPYRTTLIDDLLHRHKLKGLTSAELDKLMGPPTDTEYWREWDRVYWLGPERGYFSIDSEWLVVRFKNGRVSQYELVRD